MYKYKKRYSLKNYFFPIFIFVLLLAGLGAGLVLVRERQLVGSKAATTTTANASLTLSGPSQVNVEQDFKVYVLANTSSQPVMAGDIIIKASHMDSPQSEFLSINTPCLIDIRTNPKFLFTPLDQSGNFNKNLAMEKLNGSRNTNYLGLGFSTYNWSKKTLSTPMKGIYGLNNPLIALTFRVSENCQGQDRNTESGEISFTLVKDQSHLISAVNSNDILVRVNTIKVKVVK